MIVTVTNSEGVRLTFESVPLGIREREARGQHILATAPPTTTAKDRKKIRSMRVNNNGFNNEGWDD